MNNSAKYFELGKEQEAIGNPASALLMYISSFCASFNSGEFRYPYPATEKIRRLQLHLSISDSALLDMVRSYGSLTDLDCQSLLVCCIYGNLSGVHAILHGNEAAHEY